MKYIPDLQKSLIMTNTNKLAFLDIEKNMKISSHWKSNSVIRDFEVYDYNNCRNCVSFINDLNEITTVDWRVKKPVQCCQLNKARGVTSSVNKLRGERYFFYINKNSINLVGTYKGYLLSYELRANLCANMRRLYMDKKPLPITS